MESEHIFQVHILTAERPFYEGPCESVIVNTVHGAYGVMAHHSNMISALLPGMLTYRLPGEDDRIAYVSAGIIKVEDNDVLILVESAERPEEIDVNRARRAADEAREALLQRKSIQEYRSAKANLGRAIGRLRVKNSYDLSRRKK